MSTNLAAAPAKKGHPKGLYLLFTTELWERMSFYGMRALLVLYMVDKSSGFGWEQSFALKIYGLYTFGVYVTPVFGGLLADRFFGQRKTVLWGGILMMLGHFLIAFPGEFAFFGSLGLLMAGNGLFKPNISTMVGGLYPQGDERRDGAFTIFYVGINIGAALGSILCGALAASLGWHWGFAAAGVGMGLGLVVYLMWAQKLLGNIGVEPTSKNRDNDVDAGPLTTVDYHRIAVIVILSLFIVPFWVAFEQAGGLLNIYTDTKVDRTIGSMEIPTALFQSLNPIFIITLGPLFAMMWSALGRRGRDPNPAVKMSLGLLLVGLGFIVMVFAAEQASEVGKAAMAFIVFTYLLHTIGELCLSPVGLSTVTKLAHARVGSLMMGVWFLSNAIAYLIAGFIGAAAADFGEQKLFGWIAGATIVAGLILLAISPLLHKWMHGAADQAPPQAPSDVPAEGSTQAA